MTRRRFLKLLDARLTDRIGDGPSITLAILDADNFKAVNDRLGHAAGDAALIALVRTCRETLRNGDAIGRLGGEEFGILLETASPVKAMAICEQVRATVAETYISHLRETFAITISAGLAEAGPNETAESLLRRADASLYEAKAARRNTLRCAA